MDLNYPEALWDLSNAIVAFAAAQAIGGAFALGRDGLGPKVYGIRWAILGVTAAATCIYCYGVHHIHTDLLAGVVTDPAHIRIWVHTSWGRMAAIILVNLIFVAAVFAQGPARKQLAEDTHGL